MSDNGSPNVQQKPEDGGQSEHLNIKVTDNNNEVFFKIKRTTALGKLMNAFCDRQGKNISSVRFLFDGQRVTAADNPDTVRERIAVVYIQGKAALLEKLLTRHSSTCRTATPLKSTRSRLVAADRRPSATVCRCPYSCTESRHLVARPSPCIPTSATCRRPTRTRLLSAAAMAEKRHGFCFHI